MGRRGDVKRTANGVTSVAQTLVDARSRALDAVTESAEYTRHDKNMCVRLSDGDSRSRIELWIVKRSRIGIYAAGCRGDVDGAGCQETSVLGGRRSVTSPKSPYQQAWSASTES